MSDKNNFNVNRLKGVASFVLFATSYTPLFILVIAKQVFENYDFLSWGGLNFDALSLCIRKFGLAIFLTIISVFGFWGYKMTLKQIEKYSANGYNVMVTNVDNRNSDSIGYIATYIMPFLFQNLNSYYELFAFIFLMIIIYRIYVNSNMILINPILNFKYSIFQIEYELNGKKKNGLVITKDKYLLEDKNIKIYEIGFKLYYAVKSEEY
jgi:hypothetical protein